MPCRNPPLTNMPCNPIAQAALALGLLAAAGCRRDAEPESPLPPDVRSGIEKMPAAAPDEQPELARKIARAVWPAHDRNIISRGQGRWAVNHLLADLTGDSAPEHILTLWHQTEYRGCVAVYGRLPDGKPFRHLELFDRWNNRPPEALVFNNESPAKYLVCRYESITHHTSTYESRFRVLRWLDGAFRPLADLPEVYHSRDSNTRLRFSVCGDDLRIKVDFTFTDPTARTNIVDGHDVVWLRWDPATRSLLPEFHDTEGQPDLVDSNRWAFLLRRGSTAEADFWRCWPELRQKPTPNLERSGAGVPPDAVAESRPGHRPFASPRPPGPDAPGRGKTARPGFRRPVDPLPLLAGPEDK